LNDGVPAALRRLRELQVEIDDVACPQPDWLRFLFDVGETIGVLPARIRGAVVLPVSRLAAATICAGVVVTRAAFDWGMSPDAEEHVRRLQDLPVDSPVTLVRGSRLLRGLFRGLRTDDDRRIRLGVRVESRTAGGLTHWIDVRDALNVQPTAEVRRLPDSQKGDLVHQGSPLLEHLFGPASGSFARSVRTDAICVGNKRVLNEDLAGLTLRWRTSTRASGTIAELARVADLGVPPRASRARWRAAAPKIPAESVDSGAVVIYTDAGAFLRGRTAYSSASWLAVLDRTDSAFDEAAQTSRQVYLDEGGQPVRWERALPRGVELLLWNTP
jgi:hypothetical protein